MPSREAGVQISLKVAQSFDEIVGKARKVDELVAEIATASNEQTQGITQVATAVSQMDRVTQSNAAGAEEAASASEELNAQAEVMRESVRQLRDLVGGIGVRQHSATFERTIVAPSKRAAARRQLPMLASPGTRGAELAASGKHDDFFK